MSEDLISRQAAIATAISGRVRTLPTTEDGEDWIRVSEVRESLYAVPSIDAAPVKHGRWTIEDCHPATYKYCCSECGAHHRAMYDYCPTCGACMED